MDVPTAAVSRLQAVQAADEPLPPDLAVPVEDDSPDSVSPAADSASLAEACSLHSPGSAFQAEDGSLHFPGWA